MIKRENDTLDGGKSWEEKNEDNSAKMKQEGENSRKNDGEKPKDNRVLKGMR